MILTAIALYLLPIFMPSYQFFFEISSRNYSRNYSDLQSQNLWMNSRRWTRRYVIERQGRASVPLGIIFVFEMSSTTYSPGRSASMPNFAPCPFFFVNQCKLKNEHFKISNDI
jgi:hypothetical protein